MHKLSGLRPSSKKERPLQGKKVLSIYYKHKQGGLCKRLYMMFDALVEAGAEVHYIAVDPYPISNPKIFPHLLWVPFKNKDGIFFWAYFFLTTPFYIFIVAHREKIDMVSVFGAVYGFLAIFLKVLLQTPILTFVRSDTSAIGRMLGHSQWRLYLEEQIVSIGLRMSDQIITVNRPLMKILSQRTKIAPDKMTVLYNNVQDHSEGLRERKFSRSKLGLDKASFIILTMAVLDRRKNIELIIRSSAFLNSPAVFLIVGEGPEKNKLERLAETIGGTSKIIFTGWQSDVTGFIKAADLFVLPSKHEGCSNALLEALSFGLPCLASDTLENQETLASDELVFDPMDAKALSNKIDTIIEDPHYYEKIKVLSDNARKRLLFNWDEIIVQIHAEALCDR